MAGNNTVNVKDKEREFIIECIELYRSLPALWQIKNKLYHNRDQKSMAYDVLLVKYNEMFPQATKEDLKKKFNTLRTNYRKELKKQDNSMKSGASTDSIYVPTLWYFKEMNFLRDQELPLHSETSMNTHTITTAERDEDNEEQRSEIQSSIQEVQVSQPTTNIHASKKARKNEQLLNLAYERLTQVKDEHHHWGMACAADLRKMEKTQQLYAKKAIAEILMEGQLGLLHRHSIIINENSPFHSTPQFSNEMPPPSYGNHITPSPSPVYTNPSPSPVYANPSPSPVYANPSPSPVYANPSPSPVYANSSPSPVYANPTPSPVYANSSPSPVYTNPTPSPEILVNSIPSPSVKMPLIPHQVHNFNYPLKKNNKSNVQQYFCSFTDE